MDAVYTVVPLPLMIQKRFMEPCWNLYGSLGTRGEIPWDPFIDPYSVISRNAVSHLIDRTTQVRKTHEEQVVLHCVPAEPAFSSEESSGSDPAMCRFPQNSHGIGSLRELQENPATCTSAFLAIPRHRINKVLEHQGIHWALPTLFLKSSTKGPLRS